jgi:hypothetical protein
MMGGAEQAALIGLLVTTISGVIAQLMGLRRQSLSSKESLLMFRAEAEERRAAAKELIEQTRTESSLLAEKVKNEAFLLAERTKAEAFLLAEETKAEAALLAAKAQQQNIELKLLMLRREKENVIQTANIVDLIKEGQDIAQRAAGVSREERTVIAGMVETVAKKADAAFAEANAANKKIEEAHQSVQQIGEVTKARTDKLEELVAETKKVEEIVTETNEHVKAHLPATPPPEK